MTSQRGKKEHTKWHGEKKGVRERDGYRDEGPFFLLSQESIFPSFLSGEKEES